MRYPRCFLALSWVLAAGLLAACADEDDPVLSSSGSAGSGGSGAGGSADGGGGSGNKPPTGLSGTAIDTYATLAEQVTVPRDPSSFALIEAIVPTGSDMVAYSGAIKPDGTLEIPDVPQTSFYWLMMMSPPPADLPFSPGYRSYISNSARTLDLGSVYSFRQDISLITQPTFVTLDVSLSEPWKRFSVDGSGNAQDVGDDLQIVSFGADVTTQILASSTGAEENAPAEGATSLSGWTINASRLFRGAVERSAHLIDTSKKDDIAVLHDVAVNVTAQGQPDMPDPWSNYSYRATAEALHPASAVMTDGGTITLDGAFEPSLPKTFSLDYVGSLFEKVLDGGPVGSKASAAAIYDSASLSVRILRTPRSPDPAYGSTATLLDVNVPAIKVWKDAVCNPDSCDPMACDKGCDTAHSLFLPGDHAQDFAYVDPFDFGQELGVVTLSFSTDVTALLPGDGTQERIEGAIVVQTTAARLASGPIEPVLGVPLNIRVNNKIPFVDKVTAGVGTTPIITFEYPDFGTPELFQVRLIELDDVIGSGGTVIRNNRPVATFVFRGPPLRIPDGMMQPGKHYYVQVAALATGVDRSLPFHLLANYAMGQSYTGIFTP